MARSAMKEQLHQRLWGAQARWFRLREAGMTKHDLKIRGLREQGDVSAKTGSLNTVPTAGASPSTRKVSAKPGTSSSSARLAAVFACWLSVTGTPSRA